MVDEAVDHGGGDDGVAQHFAPPSEGLVRGDDHRGAFVAGGDELEEQVGGLGFEGDVADFVDDDEGVAAEAAEFVVDAVGVVGGGETVDPFGGGGEGDAVAGLAGADGQAMARWVLPVPGGPRNTTLSRAAMKSRAPRWAMTSHFRERWWSKSNSSSVLRAGKRAARMRISPPLAWRAATSRSKQAARNSWWVQSSARARSASR